MTFEQAIREAIIQYWEGVEPEELTKATGKKPKYNKKYFDDAFDGMGEDSNEEV